MTFTATLGRREYFLIESDKRVSKKFIAAISLLETYISL
jgi:hypothetical protein